MYNVFNLPFSQHHLEIELYWACRNGAVKRVTNLLEEGAQVYWRDKTGWTSFHTACYNDRPEVMEVLLKHAPNINLLVDHWGDNPLHLACESGSLKCVKLLLATGQCCLG